MMKDRAVPKSSGHVGRGHAATTTGGDGHNPGLARDLRARLRAAEARERELHQHLIFHIREKEVLMAQLDELQEMCDRLRRSQPHSHPSTAADRQSHPKAHPMNGPSVSRALPAGSAPSRDGGGRPGARGSSVKDHGGAGGAAPVRDPAVDIPLLLREKGGSIRISELWEVYQEFYGTTSYSLRDLFAMVKSGAIPGVVHDPPASIRLSEPPTPGHAAAQGAATTSAGQASPASPDGAARRDEQAALVDNGGWPGATNDGPREVPASDGWVKQASTEGDAAAAAAANGWRAGSETLAATGGDGREASPGDSGGWKNEDSGGWKNKDSGGWKNEDSGGWKNEDSGGWKNEDSGGWKNEDSGGWKNEESSGQKNQDSGGWKNEDAREDVAEAGRAARSRSVDGRREQQQQQQQYRQQRDVDWKELTRQLNVLLMEEGPLAPQELNVKFMQRFRKAPYLGGTPIRYAVACGWIHGVCFDVGRSKYNLVVRVPANRREDAPDDAHERASLTSSSSGHRPPQRQGGAVTHPKPKADPDAIDWKVLSAEFASLLAGGPLEPREIHAKYCQTLKKQLFLGKFTMREAIEEGLLEGVVEEPSTRRLMLSEASGEEARQTG